MGKKQSEFEKLFSIWDILVIAFGAMIGWGWVVSIGDWIERGGVLDAMLGFILGGWSGLGVIFYFFCRAKYGEKFGMLVEIANAELDREYETVGMVATAQQAGVATVQEAEVTAALDQVSAKAGGTSSLELAFNYFLPVNIIFGPGKVRQVGELAKPYGKRALIVTGRSSAKISGLYDKVNESLKAAGLETKLYDKVTQNPLTTTALEGADMAKRDGCDLIVAIGGGSIMDAAKGMAFMAVNDGDINDYIYNRKHSDKALPLILIPTTCGTGSEGNGFAVLTNPENGDKKSLRCPAIVAKASIVDPECMMTMPKKVLASVGFDAFCHCIEAYTANNAQPFTDALALYAIPMILENLPDLYRGRESMEAWEKMSIASTIGGMVINTAGVTLAHGMEHPVSGLKNVVHGQGLAALTPVAVEATWQGNRYKFGRLAHMMGGYTAEDCAEKIRSFLRSLDMEVSLSDLGIEEKDIPWLAENCMKVSAGNLVNTPVPLTQKDIEALYRRALYGAVADKTS